VAEADFYPQISLNATFGWSAQELKDLFAHGSFRGSVGPRVSVGDPELLRILNNVRVQDAHFQELVAQIPADRSQGQWRGRGRLGPLLESPGRDPVREGERSRLSRLPSRKQSSSTGGGLTDFNRVAVLEELLVSRQNQLAQAQGDIALGLIQVYRALGGGWQIRCESNAA